MFNVTFFTNNENVVEKYNLKNLLIKQDLTVFIFKKFNIGIILTIL